MILVIASVSTRMRGEKAAVAEKSVAASAVYNWLGIYSANGGAQRQERGEKIATDGTGKSATAGLGVENDVISMMKGPDVA